MIKYSEMQVRTENSIKLAIELTKRKVLSWEKITDDSENTIKEYFEKINTNKNNIIDEENSFISFEHEGIRILLLKQAYNEKGIKFIYVKKEENNPMLERNSIGNEYTNQVQLIRLHEIIQRVIKEPKYEYEESGENYDQNVIYIENYTFVK